MNKLFPVPDSHIDYLDIALAVLGATSGHANDVNAEINSVLGRITSVNGVVRKPSVFSIRLSEISA